MYADLFFVEAIDRGVRQVNLDDLGSTFSSIVDVTTDRELLVELRATIEMCYVRSAEAASSDISDPPARDVPQTLIVPNLQIGHSPITYKGPEFWLDLAERLEEQYANLLDAIDQEEGAGAAVTQGVMTAVSLRTGGIRAYRNDVGPSVGAFATSVTLGTVVLSWGIVTVDTFARYEVQRGLSSDMANAQTVEILTDNHSVTATDEPGLGTWYYRIAAVNRNNLRGFSAVSEVVVA